MFVECGGRVIKLIGYSNKSSGSRDLEVPMIQNRTTATTTKKMKRDIYQLSASNQNQFRYIENIIMGQ